MAAKPVRFLGLAMLVVVVLGVAGLVGLVI
jgi:hypothetical protein